MKGWPKDWWLYVLMIGAAGWKIGELLTGYAKPTVGDEVFWIGLLVAWLVMGLWREWRWSALKTATDKLIAALRNAGIVP